MFKKFLSAIILAFAFLFFNVNAVNAVENTSGLPDEVFVNAGIGEKMGYWAVVNYGEEYISSDEIVIDIDKNAIANQDIQYILIDETGCVGTGADCTGEGKSVYYKRNKDVEFSGRINYTLKNKFIDKKSVTIFLLTDLSNNPSTSLIVDKITVGIDHKRLIKDIDESKIKINQELTADMTSAFITVTLDDSVINDYVIKGVTYKHTKDKVFLNAEELDFNEFEFIAYQNGEYIITLEDAFKTTKTISVNVSGIIPAPIIIETIPTVTVPTNSSYDVIINVYEVQGENTIIIEPMSFGVNDNLEYKFNDALSYTSIKNQVKDGSFYLNVTNNGRYTIKATHQGRETEFVLIITNIDREAPFMQVANNLIVYTESIDMFVPEHEVFVHDNVTPGEQLMETLQIEYYYLTGAGDKIFLSTDKELEDSYYRYLYSVREIYIRYTVWDEAGNITSGECSVTPIDDTKPTISYSPKKMILYINDIIADVAGNNKRIETFFNLVVTDNNINGEVTYTKSWDLSTITDANGMIRVSELTKNGRIFVVAVDAAGNESDIIVLSAEVCERLIKIEGDFNQFVVYGEYTPETPILYHCIDVVRDEAGNEILDEFGNPTYQNVDCQTLLLEGDKLIGNVYIEDARYVGEYPIKYDRINVPSKLYSLDYGEDVTFEIIPRKLKVNAKDLGKLYLDRDPDFSIPENTYYIDTSVCGLTREEEQERYNAYKNGASLTLDIYRCEELTGDKLKGNLIRYDGLPQYLEGYEDVYYYEIDGIDYKEFVWYRLDDEEKEIVVSRPIMDPGQEFGGLYVDEGDPNLDNYEIEFVEGRFTIYPKSVNIQIQDKTKIYGEDDPIFDINHCTIFVYVGAANDTDGKNDGYMEVEDCSAELGIILVRDAGETVFGGPYEIHGDWTNKNYTVNFSNGILNIIQRDISLVIEGDEGTPGIYTIVYEDDLPNIVLLDATSNTEEKGLVTLNRNNLGIDDKFNLPIDYVIYDSYGRELEYYTDEYGNIVPDYAADNLYYIRIRIGSTIIIDLEGNESDSNYNIDYTEGIIKVVKKDIYIKVKDKVDNNELLKIIYGQNDPHFTNEDLEAMFPGQKYIILDGFGNFVIEIANDVTLDSGEPYIPRDHDEMVYYLKRVEGIYVGEYPIRIYDLEGCGNYNVEIVGEPKFIIIQRDMEIVIDNQDIVYRDEYPVGEYSYDEERASRSLQYNDMLVGKPNVYTKLNCYVGVKPAGSELQYCNVGNYPIGQGSITVMDETGEIDLGYNYNFIVTDGSINVFKRTITIESTGNEKFYGEYDPILTYIVLHEGQIEDCDQLQGELYRMNGYDEYEIPRLNENGTVYEYPILSQNELGEYTLKVKPVFDEPQNKYVENYEIIGWNLEKGLKIKKLNITLIPNTPSKPLHYGDNYDEQIFLKNVEGNKTAYNEDIIVAVDEIDGSNIHLEDHMDGELFVSNGPIDGVGTYIISTEQIRIVRNINREKVDVSDYYNITRETGTITIIERELKISVKEGLTKVYGEADPDWSNLSELITISCDALNCLVDPDDKIVGEIVRRPNINAAGNLVMEDAGIYDLSIENLKVVSANGKENYRLTKVGSPVFIITKRDYVVRADWQTIIFVETVEEITLTYTETGTMASWDKLEGEITLGQEYKGCGYYHDDQYKTEGICGSYSIVQGTLSLTNEHNYNSPWFIPGVLLVQKRKITVTPDTNFLTKVYGTADPELKFTLDYENAVYEGGLTREPGEDVGKYKVIFDTLKFLEENYEVVKEKDYYFEIIARKVKLEVVEGLGKIYLGEEEDFVNWCNLDDILKISGTIIAPDRLMGCLNREEGETVGLYKIKGDNIYISKGNSLQRSSNYQIEFIEGIFEIYYVDITSVEIVPLTNNKYQIYNETSDVKVEAKFNVGANPAYLKDVQWSVVKRLNNGDVSEWKFSKNPTTNVVTFLPSGDVGTYIVTARYGPFEDTYEVLVEMSTVRNVYIHLIQDLSGNVNQILGREEYMTYGYTVTGEVKDTNVVRWYVNGTLMKEDSATNFEYFTFKPNGKGTYEVYAQIVNKASDPLYVYVANNNPPVISLNGEPVIYIEARSGKPYEDPGYTVSDDITSQEWLDSHRIPPTGIGDVDVNTKGTYYVRYDAVDEHGNYAVSVYRQIIVRDTTPPVVTLNGDEYVTLMFGEPYNELGAIAIDNYDGEVEVMISNGIRFDRIGLYEVQYIAYDSSGNRGTAVRSVKIIDNISPQITLIGNEVMHIEVYSEFQDPGAQVVDNVDGNFVLKATSIFYSKNINDEPVKVDNVDTNKLGYYYAHYDYTDSAGNIGVGKVRTIIVEDTTAPVITLKGTNPYIVRYSNTTVDYDEPGAIVTDNYDKNLTYTVSGEIGHELGTYYLYYDAVDSSGNAAERVTRQIVVVDVRNPILSFNNEALCPQYMTIEALYEEYDTRCDRAGFGVWVEDDYSEDKTELLKRLVVTGVVDNTTVGLYVISYDIVDMAGNSAVTLKRYVNVVDTTAPVLTLKGGGENGEQIVEVFEDYEELGVNIDERYDNYHNIPVNVTITKNINTDRLGEYQVIYNAVDSNGNRAVPVMRIVYVKDTTPPVITLNGEELIVIERGLEYIEYGATVMDNYDGPIKKYTITNAPSGMILGNYTVTYRAIDSSGNIGEATRIVKVVDTIPPIVLGVEDGMYYRNPVSIYFVPTIGTNETLRGWLNGEEITSPWFVEKEGEYNLLVKDDADNKVEIWFAIDTTPPEILGIKDGEYTNKDVEIYSNEKVQYFTYRYQSGDWLKSEEQKIKFTKEGIYRINATDMAGNESSTVVFIIDKTAPVYTLLGVENKGVTEGDVTLITEEEATVVVNAAYNIDNNYTFNHNGYYQVALRDLAGNVVNLQFVINDSKIVTVNEKDIAIMDQYNAINKVTIKGQYSRNSGYMIAKPLLNGGFEYVSGKLFSEADYQTLISGKELVFNVSPTDDTYMFVAFVVESSELNKFGSQTVDGDNSGGTDGEEEKEEDNGLYILLFALVAAIGGGFFWLFLKRRREEEDDDEEEIVVDDY